MGCAERHCNGRVISVLESGSDPNALAASVVFHVDTLLVRGVTITRCHFIKVTRIDIW